jgi:YD repeat-containing protein
MTTRDQYHLRGPVHSCQIQRIWHATGTEANERTNTTSLEFRPDGLLAHQLHHNPDGSEWTTTYNYDQAGRLQHISTENSAGPVSLAFHEYDDAGRLARIFTRPDGTNEHNLETYEYDAEGCKSQTRLVDPRVHGVAVQGSDTAYPSRGAAKVVTRYNQRDQPNESLFQDQSGRLLSRVDFRYDNDGNLIEETQTHIATAMPPELAQEGTAAQLEAARAMFGSVHQLHTYDQQGRRVRTRVRIGPLSDEITNRTYNEHGDEVEVINESIQRGYNLDEEGRISETPTEERVTRSETLFRYDYDAPGNWTTKAIQSPGGELSTIERRTISYFNEDHNETPGDPIRSPQGPAHDPKIHP